VQTQCPQCGKVVSAVSREELPYRPFCSKRCRMVDLGKWLDGSYCITEDLRPGDVGDELRDSALDDD